MLVDGAEQAVAAAASEESASTNVEPEEETAESGDANDPFRIKRQHGHGGFNPLSGILSGVFNKKLGLIGSLSSVSSSSSGSGKHVEPAHGYEYSVSFPASAQLILQ